MVWSIGCVINDNIDFPGTIISRNTTFIISDATNNNVKLSTQAVNSTALSELGDCSGY